jgi:hypothetical protein
MSFLYPQFFWALTALSIPVLIHFFNFRRHKTLAFSNTAFLRMVERNTRSINKLRQWLILASRLAAFTFLILAFTQPIVPLGSANGSAPTHFSIYIDNSFSMSLKGTEGPLLNRAREKAAQLIESLPGNAKVQVVTNTFKPQSLVFSSKKAALQQIDQIKLNPNFKSFAQIKGRVEEAWNNAPRLDSALLNLFIFSDLQQVFWPSLATESIHPDWRIGISQLKPANNTQNIAIDSVWFSRPVFKAGFEQELKVRLQNQTNNAQKNVGLRLNLNGTNAALAQVTIPAYSSSTTSLFFTPQKNGLYQGLVTVEDNGTTYDNTFFFNFSTQAKPQVLLVGEGLKKANLKRFFPDSLFTLKEQNLSNVDYNLIKQQNLTLVETAVMPSSGLVTALQKSLTNGHNLMLFPTKDEEIFLAYLQALQPDFKATLQTDTISGGSINYQDGYFYQVFTRQSERPGLPRVYRYYTLEANNLQSLVNLENEKPLLAYFPSLQGDVFVSATGLEPEQSNLAKHPILAPVLVNAALFQGQPAAPYARASSVQAYQFYPTPLPGDAVASLAIGEKNIIPPQRSTGSGLQIFIPPQVPQPGHYPLTVRDSLIGHFSINLDLRESQLQYLSLADFQKSALKAQLLDIDLNSAENQSYAQFYGNQELWPFCLGLALFFFIIELLLLKFWRK